MFLREEEWKKNADFFSRNQSKGKALFSNLVMQVYT